MWSGQRRVRWDLDGLTNCKRLPSQWSRAGLLQDQPVVHLAKNGLIHWKMVDVEYPKVNLFSRPELVQPVFCICSWTLGLVYEEPLKFWALCCMSAPSIGIAHSSDRKDYCTITIKESKLYHLEATWSWQSKWYTCAGTDRKLHHICSISTPPR